MGLAGVGSREAATSEVLIIAQEEEVPALTWSHLLLSCGHHWEAHQAWADDREGKVEYSDEEASSENSKLG